MQHQWKQRLQALRMFGSQTEFAAPCVELNANRQAIIEGCEGILEYNATTVRLNCKSMVGLRQRHHLRAAVFVCLKGEVLCLTIRFCVICLAVFGFGCPADLRRGS